MARYILSTFLGLGRTRTEKFWSNIPNGSWGCCSNYCQNKYPKGWGKCFLAKITRGEAVHFLGFYCIFNNKVFFNLPGVPMSSPTPLPPHNFVWQWNIKEQLRFEQMDFKLMTPSLWDREKLIILTKQYHKGNKLSNTHTINKNCYLGLSQSDYINNSTNFYLYFDYFFD